MPPEGDSGSTGEKQIGDLHFCICIGKSPISFSSVTPGSSSGVTKVVKESKKETHRSKGK